jgi:hypothetical protein
MEYVTTKYGYGKVVSRSKTKVSVKLERGALAFLQLESVSTEAIVYIKTFVGDRRLLKYSFNVNHTIDLLK